MSMALLLRRSIGFEPLNDWLEAAARYDNGGAYPPYNIQRHGADQYHIVIAVAGFKEAELGVQVVHNVLVIVGKRQAVAVTTYLRQGIAQRAFKLSFRLAEHIEVCSADLAQGLLSIVLERRPPEAANVQQIPINKA